MRPSGPAFKLPEFHMTVAASQDGTTVFSEYASDPEYRELLEMFAEALPERRRCLTDSFRSGNAEELRVLAHQLKGAGGGFGFPELTRRAAELEAACREGRSQAVADSLDRLVEFMSRISI